jgi:hypothetical protein
MPAIPNSKNICYKSSMERDVMNLLKGGVLDPYANNKTAGGTQGNGGKFA